MDYNNIVLFKLMKLIKQEKTYINSCKGFE